jgi:hypothetical protein
MLLVLMLLTPKGLLATLLLLLPLMPVLLLLPLCFQQGRNRA